MLLRGGRYCLYDVHDTLVCDINVYDHEAQFQILDHNKKGWNGIYTAFDTRSRKLKVLHLVKGLPWFQEREIWISFVKETNSPFKMIGKDVTEHMLSFLSDKITILT